MINRKVLYGYQIQNGTLEIVPEAVSYTHLPSLFLENCIPAIRITTRTEERSAQCAPRPVGSLAASRGERFYLRRGGVGSAARRDAVRADNETQCTGQHEEAGLLRD